MPRKALVKGMPARSGTISAALLHYGLKHPHVCVRLGLVADAIERITKFSMSQQRDLSYWLNKIDHRVPEHASYERWQCRRKTTWAFQEASANRNPGVVGDREKARAQAQDVFNKPDLLGPVGGRGMANEAANEKTAAKAARQQELEDKRAARETAKAERAAAKETRTAAAAHKKEVAHVERVRRNAFQSPNTSKIFDLTQKGFGMLAAYCTEFKRPLKKGEYTEAEFALMRTFIQARDEQKGKLYNGEDAEKRYAAKVRGYWTHGLKVVQDRIADSEIDYVLLDKPPLLRQLPEVPELAA